MSNWKHLITRETVLLERYFRVDGYRNMFPNKSGVKVNNLLVVNKNGLTAQYDLQSEIDERQKIIWAEYKKNYLKKLLPFWSDVIEKLKKSADSLLTEKKAVNFKNFFTWYQLARGIVFYTHYLGQQLESKGMMKEVESIGEWHERAEVESCTAWDKLASFFSAISKKHEISPRMLMFYLPDEFFKLLNTGKTVKNSELQNRQQYYVLWLQNGNIKFFTEKEARVIEMKQLPHEKIAEAKEIKGSIACKGKASGIVQIVNTSADIEKMRDGNILVSIMTTPRLLPAIKKASAIVTDEGGITCHAAIVSREFNIPCIIGTKIASKVLKDGDIVEVNADNGIVKLIK